MTGRDVCEAGAAGAVVSVCSMALAWWSACVPAPGLPSWWSVERLSDGPARCAPTWGAFARDVCVPRECDGMCVPFGCPLSGARPCEEGGGAVVDGPAELCDAFAGAPGGPPGWDGGRCRGMALRGDGSGGYRSAFEDCAGGSPVAWWPERVDGRRPIGALESRWCGCPCEMEEFVCRAPPIGSECPDPLWWWHGGVCGNVEPWAWFCPPVLVSRVAP